VGCGSSWCRWGGALAGFPWRETQIPFENDK
jgi:hypothetical protein